MLKANNIVTTTGEINTQVQFTEEVRLQTEATYYYQYRRDDVSYLAGFHDICLGILQEVSGHLGGEAQLLRRIFLCIVLEQQTGNEHCRYERRDDTNHIGNSEALDRTCTEDSQDSTC